MSELGRLYRQFLLQFARPLVFALIVICCVFSRLGKRHAQNMILGYLIQENIIGSNTGGLFTMAVSNSFLST